MLPIELFEGKSKCDWWHEEISILQSQIYSISSICKEFNEKER